MIKHASKLQAFLCGGMGNTAIGAKDVSLQIETPNNNSTNTAGGDTRPCSEASTNDSRPVSPYGRQSTIQRGYIAIFNGYHNALLYGIYSAHPMSCNGRYETYGPEWDPLNILTSACALLNAVVDTSDPSSCLRNCEFSETVYGRMIACVCLSIATKFASGSCIRPIARSCGRPTTLGVLYRATFLGHCNLHADEHDDALIHANLETLEGELMCKLSDSLFKLLFRTSVCEAELSLERLLEEGLLTLDACMVVRNLCTFFVVSCTFVLPTGSKTVRELADVGMCMAVDCIHESGKRQEQSAFRCIDAHTIKKLLVPGPEQDYGTMCYVASMLLSELQGGESERTLPHILPASTHAAYAAFISEDVLSEMERVYLRPCPLVAAKRPQSLPIPNVLGIVKLPL
jgi:hypothetical protein